MIVFTDDAEMVDALATGRVDAIVRSEVGNGAAAELHVCAFAVTVLDTRAEISVFSLGAADAALAACLDGIVSMRCARRRSGTERSP